MFTIVSKLFSHLLFCLIINSFINPCFTIDRYSATTIAKDLKELNIYRVPIDCETWIYKAINNQTEQEMREFMPWAKPGEVLTIMYEPLMIELRTSCSQ
jgi:transcriptional regulator of arginine metabolism